MADEAAERPSAINALGASAVVGVLGVVVVWWAVTAHRPVGVVVGAVLLVLALAGAGAGIGRTVRGAVVGGGVALVVAVAVLGGLVVQARSVDVGGDPAVALDDRVELAWADGDDLIGFDHASVVAIAADGTTRAGEPLAIGQDIVARGTAALATTDRDGVIVRDRDGLLLWAKLLTVDERPAERVAVVAIGADGAGAVQACLDIRCDLVGIAADGREVWRQATDDARFGRGPIVVGGIQDRPLREAPARLVVVDGADGADGADAPDAPDARAEEVDLATGDRTPLGAAGVVGVVGDTVTIARVGADGCEIGIVRGDAAEEVVPSPCPEGGFGTAEPIGDVVVHQQQDGIIAVDGVSGEAAAVTLGAGRRLGLAGDGVVVAAEPDGTVGLHRIADDTEIARFDRAWRYVASGPDGLVLTRERESGNPFAPEDLLEVAVVDPASGEICARVRLDEPFLARASPLPGCRAVVSPPDGPDVLVG